MSDHHGYALALIGAGKMGAALLRGWLAAGTPAETIAVVDPHASDDIKALADSAGFALNPPAAPAQTIVLAIKPQMLEAAAPDLAPWFSADGLLISILAGKTIDGLSAQLPARAVVRAMPNTPAAIGRGVAGAFANRHVTPAQHEQAAALLSAVGAVEWVGSEAAIDAVTAISGSGPAYVFHLVEALAMAGEKLGLPPDLSMRLARATVEGSGELLFRAPEISPEILRKNVTSPGGTTEAALKILMAPDGFPLLLEKAAAAAAQRARELSA